MKKLIILLILIVLSATDFAQVPFHKGINLTNWFQASNSRQIQFTKFTQKDFEQIKSLGCDVIRLPINLHQMTSGAPDYVVDPVLFSLLDSAVNWAEKLQLYLLLDNHSFDPTTNTSPDIGLVLNKVWPQLADHYKNRSAYIMYEVLNEPHGITNQLWGTIQQQAIDAIRSKDNRHTIIVGPSGYNSYNDLAQMPVYSDPNLIYTFHFYDPFLFTHQGASWVSPSMVPLAGVPFPYNPLRMPACPPSLKGSWIESSLSNYGNDGTVAKVKSLIDIAVNFRDTNHVPVYCGEFGVYIPNSDTADRAFWYKTVKDYLEEKSIPWTTWDYKGGFGLFRKGTQELFESDLNIPLLKALSFNIPIQRTYHLLPDSVGFMVYDDYIAHGINEASYTTGIIDYYSTLLPNNNTYCIFWSGGAQYTAIAMDFVPDRDLSELVGKGYALDMFVRGNTADIKFDVRFVDTKTAEPTDHPWRMRTTLSNNVVNWDNRWHHVHIPLSSFAEQGAWDNNTWYNPTGKFDWKAIDRLEIVSEYGSLDNKEIWFDNISITDQDTAQVIEKGTLGINRHATVASPLLRITPNPMTNSATISCLLPESGPTCISIYNLNGQKITDVVNCNLQQGPFTVQWLGNDDSGHALPGGIYVCRLTTATYRTYCKLLKAD